MSKRKKFWVKFTASMPVEATSLEEAYEILYDILTDGIGGLEICDSSAVQETDDDE